ncbi:MAG: hypothetical protein OQK55_01020, partial [Thermoanaerobaculales bacterium]|nr:hypothetical protein [Thermoanaerobaculales bacterium]
HEVSELVIDPQSVEAMESLRAVEKESNNSVFRLIAFARDEPFFEVSDARLGQSDRLVLLVSEGRPLEILEPYDVSKLGAPNGGVEMVTSNEPRTLGSQGADGHSQ